MRFAYLLDYFQSQWRTDYDCYVRWSSAKCGRWIFDEIYGTPSGEVPVKDRTDVVRDPICYLTNYDQPSKDMGKLGAVYLSSYVLKLAGLDMPFIQPVPS